MSASAEALIDAEIARTKARLAATYITLSVQSELWRLSRFNSRLIVCSLPFREHFGIGRCLIPCLCRILYLCSSASDCPMLTIQSHRVGH
jgi:hypothetical protein